MEGDRPPTLADVAAAAAVSTSTASRALQDSPLVSEPTRRRIHEIADGLGFEPNRVARSLRTRSSMLVGVVVPDVAIAFYAAALKGAQDVLEHEGYGVLVMNTERDPEREAESVRTLRAHRVDGLLVATSGGFAPTDATPVVFFDHVAPWPGASSVAPANRDGMQLLVDHLSKHGHERVGFIGALGRLTSASERLDGFNAAVVRNGLQAHIAFGDTHWSEQSGERATHELLRNWDPPTAVVAAGDTFALGALRALRDRGLRVPEDIAIVSFDDPPAGDLLGLTALRSHAAELGRRGAGILLRVLDGRPLDNVRIDLDLTIRTSCGCD